MELKYRFVLYIGFAAAVLISILLLIKKKKQTKYADGVKLANTYVLDKDDYYLAKINNLSIIPILIICGHSCSLNTNYREYSMNFA